MKRYAVVTRGGAIPVEAEQVQKYLPANYSAGEIDGEILIVGEDNHGWTLDGYVIPRLASGLIWAAELKTETGGRA